MLAHGRPDQASETAHKYILVICVCPPTGPPQVYISHPTGFGLQFLC